MIALALPHPGGVGVGLGVANECDVDAQGMTPGGCPRLDPEPVIESAVNAVRW